MEDLTVTWAGYACLSAAGVAVMGLERSTYTFKATLNGTQ